MDREKVIKGLELCEIGSDYRCYETECPYYEQGCTESLKNDILAMLKEQEAVQPVRGEDDDFYCGRCGKKIAKTIKIYDGYSFVKTHPDHMKPECKCNFCKYCGQAVKWE